MKKQMNMTDNRRQIIRVVLCCAIFSLFIMLFSLKVLAASGVVNTSNVNVRAKASATSEAVGSANENDKVTILAEETGADGKLWYKVKLTDGTTGYIRSDFIKKDADTSAEEETTQVTTVAEKKAYVKGENGVNIRKAASATSTKIATAVGGSEVTIIGEATGSDGNLWYQIQFDGNGTKMKGFIRSDLIDFNKPEQNAEVVEIGGEADSEEPASEEELIPESPVTDSDAAQKTEVTADVSELMVLEPESMLENIPAGFEQVEIMFGENSVTAWAKGDFYIFYASKSNDTPQWYLYDRTVKGYVKYTGLFSNQTIIVEENASVFNWLTFVLLAFVILLIAAVVVLVLMLLKKRDDYYGEAEAEYDDDDEEDYDNDDAFENVKETPPVKHEMNYVNQRPMQNKVVEPKTLIMPAPNVAYEDEELTEEVEEEYEEDEMEEATPKTRKKKGFGQKLLDYFTTEVEEDDDDDEDEEDDDDNDDVIVSDDDDDDDLNFIDL